MNYNFNWQLVKYTFRNIFFCYVVMIDPVYTIVFTHKTILKGE